MEPEKRCTMYDLARILGVSVGTIHRALHNTGRIRPETKARILETARQMNYQINPNAQALRSRALRIGILLCCPVRLFGDEIGRGIVSAVGDLSEFNLSSDLRVVYHNAQDRPEIVHSALRDFSSGEYSAAVLFFSGTSDLFRDDLKRLDASGIPVVSIVNDIPLTHRVLHVAADGYAAGRMAADMLDLCCPGGRVAVLTGSDATFIHHQNLQGFRDQSAPDRFSGIEVFEHYDDPKAARAMLSEILHAQDPFDGLYVTSSGVAESLSLLDSFDPERLPHIVTTDLYDTTRNLLSRRLIRATIFQDPFRQGKKAVAELYRYLHGERAPGEIRLTPQIILPSNASAFQATAEDELRSDTGAR